MAQNRVMRVGPVSLTTTLTTNILNCGITSLAGPIGLTLTQPYLIVQYMHIINIVGTAQTFTLYLGASGANAAGTELWKGTVLPGNIPFEWGNRLYMKDTDFLVGGANANSSLTLMIALEIGFQG